MSLRRRRVDESEPLEHLRRGTLQQYQSDWFYLEPDSGSATNPNNNVASRRHELGEVPSTVYIERDWNGDGRAARDAVDDSGAAAVSFTRDREQIVVTNVSTDEGFYVRIRAR